MDGSTSTRPPLCHTHLDFLKLYRKFSTAGCRLLVFSLLIGYYLVSAPKLLRVDPTKVSPFVKIHVNAHFHLGIIPVTLKATVVALSSCGEEASEQKVKSHFPADSALLKKKKKKKCT